MGPTKAIVKQQALYDAVSGKLIQNGFESQQAMEDYVRQHYIVMPVRDHAGNPWQLDGKPVYCLHGVQYETVDDQFPTRELSRRTSTTWIDAPFSRDSDGHGAAAS